MKKCTSYPIWPKPLLSQIILNKLTPINNIQMQVQEQGMFEKKEQQPAQEQYSYPMQQYEEIEHSQQESEGEFHIMNPQEFLIHINSDFEEKQKIYCLTYGEIVTLCYHSQFQEEKFHSLFDSYNTGINLVRRNPNYKVAPFEGYCPRCEHYVSIIHNDCGYGSCKECWTGYIQSQLDGKKVIPKCPRKNCEYYINYQLLQAFWIDNQHLHELFSKNLCEQYCQKHPNIKKCPNLACENMIDISKASNSQIKCSCMFQICKFCGDEAHSPLQCDDMIAFKNIKEEFWLKGEDISEELVQFCPKCQAQTFQRDIILSRLCPRCNYKFCRSCHQEWEGHSSIFICYSQVFQDNIVIQGRLVSLKDYKQAKTQVGFIQRSIERTLNQNLQQLQQKLMNVGINQIDLELLSQMQRFLFDAFEMMKRCHIYTFFQLESHHNLKEVITFISKVAYRVDYALFNVVPQWIQYQKTFLLERQANIRQIKGQFQYQKISLRNVINPSKRLLEKIKEGEIKTAFKELSQDKTFKEAVYS